MEPGSIITLSLTSAKVLAQTSIYVYEFLQAFKKYEKTLNALRRELDGLKLVVDAVCLNFQQAQVRAVVSDPSSPLELWTGIARHLYDCRVTGEELQEVLRGRLEDHKGVWRRTLQTLKLGSSAEVIATFRGQIQSHSMYLNCALSTVQLYLACQTPHRLQNIYDRIEHLASQLPSKQLEISLGRTPSHNIRSIDMAARAVLDTASHIVETSDRSGGSIYDHESLSATARSRISDWMSKIDDDGVEDGLHGTFHESVTRKTSHLQHMPTSPPQWRGGRTGVLLGNPSKRSVSFPEDGLMTTAIPPKDQRIQGQTPEDDETSLPGGDSDTLNTTTNTAVHEDTHPRDAVTFSLLPDLRRLLRDIFRPTLESLESQSRFLDVDPSSPTQVKRQFSFQKIYSKQHVGDFGSSQRGKTEEEVFGLV